MKSTLRESLISLISNKINVQNTEQAPSAANQELLEEGNRLLEILSNEEADFNEAFKLHSRIRSRKQMADGSAYQAFENTPCNLMYVEITLALFTCFNLHDFMKILYPEVEGYLSLNKESRNELELLPVDALITPVPYLIPDIMSRLGKLVVCEDIVFDASVIEGFSDDEYKLIFETLRTHWLPLYQKLQSYRNNQWINIISEPIESEEIPKFPELEIRNEDDFLNLLVSNPPDTYNELLQNAVVRMEPVLTPMLASYIESDILRPDQLKKLAIALRYNQQKMGGLEKILLFTLQTASTEFMVHTLMVCQPEFRHAVFYFLMQTAQGMDLKNPNGPFPRHNNHRLPSPEFLDKLVSALPLAEKLSFLTKDVPNGNNVLKLIYLKPTLLPVVKKYLDIKLLVHKLFEDRTHIDKVPPENLAIILTFFPSQIILGFLRLWPYLLEIIFNHPIALNRILQVLPLDTLKNKILQHEFKGLFFIIRNKICIDLLLRIFSKEEILDILLLKNKQNVSFINITLPDFEIFSSLFKYIPPTEYANMRAELDSMGQSVLFKSSKNLQSFKLILEKIYYDEPLHVVIKSSNKMGFNLLQHTEISPNTLEFILPFFSQSEIIQSLHTRKADGLMFIQHLKEINLWSHIYEFVRALDTEAQNLFPNPSEIMITDEVLKNTERLRCICLILNEKHLNEYCLQNLLIQKARRWPASLEVLLKALSFNNRIFALQAENKRGKNLLQLTAESYECLQHIFNSFSPDEYELILDLQDSDGNTLLHHVCQTPKQKELEFILNLYRDRDKKFQALQKPNSFKNTPLHLICSKEKIDINMLFNGLQAMEIDFLLNLQNDNLETPLSKWLKLPEIFMVFFARISPEKKLQSLKNSSFFDPEETDEVRLDKVRDFDLMETSLSAPIELLISLMQYLPKNVRLLALMYADNFFKSDLFMQHHADILEHLEILPLLQNNNLLDEQCEELLRLVHEMPQFARQSRFYQELIALLPKIDLLSLIDMELDELKLENFPHKTNILNHLKIILQTPENFESNLQKWYQTHEFYIQKSNNRKRSRGFFESDKISGFGSILRKTCETFNLNGMDIFMPATQY